MKRLPTLLLPALLLGCAPKVAAPPPDAPQTEPESEPASESAPTAEASDGDKAMALRSSPSYRVATWNLEHFAPGKKRGFPEDGDGGPSYEPRADPEFEFIATTIKQLKFKLVLLQEIGGHGDSSEGLDELVKHLGSKWSYGIGSSGGSQHVAILYDTGTVKIDAFCETDFVNEKVQKKGLFDRQGFYAHATFLSGGESMNDLVVFGVHLASGQENNKNHDQAMTAYVEELKSQEGKSECIPEGEKDILIAGDFNANRFGGPKEEFWDEMEGDGWNVLADSKSTYGATRLSGVPLKRGSSIIDYMIVSASKDGLWDNEIKKEPAKIHSELLEGRTPEEFRQLASDHLPVSVALALEEDDD